MLTENCLPIAVFFTEMKQNVKVMYVPFEKIMPMDRTLGCGFPFSR